MLILNNTNATIYAPKTYIYTESVLEFNKVNKSYTKAINGQYVVSYSPPTPPTPQPPIPPLPPIILPPIDIVLDSPKDGDSVFDADNALTITNITKDGVNIDIATSGMGLDVNGDVIVDNSANLENGTYIVTVTNNNNIYTLNVLIYTISSLPSIDYYCNNFADIEPYLQPVTGNFVRIGADWHIVDIPNKTITFYKGYDGTRGAFILKSGSVYTGDRNVIKLIGSLPYASVKNIILTGGGNGYNQYLQSAKIELN